MIFWRKKKNEGAQEQEEREDKIVHHPREPGIEPSTDYDPAPDPAFVQQELAETESRILETIPIVPVPEHTPLDDAQEADEMADRSAEGGWFSRLTQGLSKSTGRIGEGIADIFTRKKLDPESLESLEDLLISADLGPKTAAALVQSLAKKRFEKDIDAATIRTALADDIAAILDPVAKPLDIQKPENGPFVILICGVNGAGKTTTIGKLAYEWHIRQHRPVMIAAGDTFRAAAIEQLEIWAKRAHTPIVKKDIGADAAAVAFEAYEQARAQGAEILMIDTAGRLQNKAGLMAELSKIVRVLKKHDENLPHAVLLVLDATTGQNAHSQVKLFREAVDVTGLIVTKLDGSARGGVVVALAQDFGLPIHAIGVGEGEEDLSPFRAKDFALALMGVNG